MPNKQILAEINFKKCCHRKWVYYYLAKSVKPQLINQMLSPARILDLKKNASIKQNAGINCQIWVLV